MELVPRYFDPRAVAAMKGRREEVTQLLQLPFDFIFFTGSTKVGKIVMKAAAENLTPVLLELGGQNPALVDETANIPGAAKKIVWGAMARRGSSIQPRSSQAGDSMPRHATWIRPLSIRLPGTIQSRTTRCLVRSSRSSPIRPSTKHWAELPLHPGRSLDSRLAGNLAWATTMASTASTPSPMRNPCSYHRPTRRSAICSPLTPTPRTKSSSSGWTIDP